MKNHRLIYSHFSSKLIELNYLIRSIWIALGAFILAIICAFESQSGFSGVMRTEAYVIYLSSVVLFYFNYLSQEYTFFFNAQFVMASLFIVVSIVLKYMPVTEYPIMDSTRSAMIAYYSGVAIIQLFQYGSVSSRS